VAAAFRPYSNDSEISPNLRCSQASVNLFAIIHSINKTS
jgi:hypothetical protein